jgi:hypothetical protein
MKLYAPQTTELKPRIVVFGVGVANAWEFVSLFVCGTTSERENHDDTLRTVYFLQWNPKVRTIITASLANQTTELWSVNDTIKLTTKLQTLEPVFSVSLML